MPSLRGAESDEGGDVERPDPDHVEYRVVGRKAQPAAFLVGIVGRGRNAGAGEELAAFGQDAAFRAAPGPAGS